MKERFVSVAVTAAILVLAIVPSVLAQGTIPPPPTEIPEAGSLLMLGTGLAGVAGYVGLRWRARK